MSRSLLELISITACIVCCYGETLFQPDEIILNDGDSLDIVAQYCTFEVISDGNLYLNMTAVCFCYYPVISGDLKCSIPGPTLIMYANTTVDVTYHSDLEGDRTVCEDADTCALFNQFTDLDIFNMHLHGVYIDPTVGHDDVVWTHLLPDYEDLVGDSQLYNYPIIADHYPGTFWYHTHHHGAITWHLSIGMFGAVLIKHEEDYDIDNIADNVLFFHWIQAVNESTCLPCTAEKVYMGSGVPNLCTIWCTYPENERNVSGATYDVKSDAEFADMDLFLVNGQYQPTIDDMFVDRFRRVRLVNAMEGWYIQYKFPSECEWYQIGADGYFFGPEFDAVNLNTDPFQNELILPMGSRADLLVKCSSAGTFHIYSSQNNAQSDELTNLNRITGEVLLFSIQVSEDIFTADVANNITDLPGKASYPEKPYYLSADIRTDEDLISTCKCNSYDDIIDNLFGEADECFIQFSGHKHMNGLEFKLGRPVTELQVDSKFEFTFYPTNGHVLHVHQYPIQVQENVAGGFIASQYEWRDTVGNYGTPWKYRFYTYDYAGPIVVHCHVVRDADLGMASYFLVGDVADKKCHEVVIVDISTTIKTGTTEVSEVDDSKSFKTGNSIFIFAVGMVVVGFI